MRGSSLRVEFGGFLLGYNMKTRICPKCKCEKELSRENFYYNKSTKTGYCCYCIDCSTKHPRKPNVRKGYKRCCNCSAEHPANNQFFYNSSSSKDGLRSKCKACLKSEAKTKSEITKKYKKQYYNKNKEKILRAQREDYQENKDKYKEKNKRSYIRNKDKISIKAKEYRQNNQEKLNKYFVEYRSRDIKHKIAHNMRVCINRRVKDVNSSKFGHTDDLIGCSFSELRSYLESLWLPRMNWNNYGVYIIGGPITWHIDHIKPCTLFDLTKESEQRKCFHYTNLQPLWADQNIAKSNKY
jgi:hypothetical protein